MKNINFKTILWKIKNIPIFTVCQSYGRLWTIFIPLISTDQGLFQQQYLEFTVLADDPTQVVVLPKCKILSLWKLENTLWHILLPRII